MRKNKQLICDSKKGDCFRACLTSILGLPNDPKLPNCDDPEWYMKWNKLLWRFGLTLIYNQDSCWKSGYWIARVKSKNFKDTTHAIVMYDLQVAHDPSLKKRYRVGQSLLGGAAVLGGHSLEVTDASKLHKLKEYLKRY